MAEAPKAEEKPLFCCQAANVDVSEGTAKCLFIVNLLTLSSLGTLISACIDKKGCNWSAFFFAYVPFLPICHMYQIWQNSKGKVWDQVWILTILPRYRKLTLFDINTLNITFSVYFYLLAPYLISKNRKDQWKQFHFSNQFLRF